MLVVTTENVPGLPASKKSKARYSASWSAAAMGGNIMAGLRTGRGE